MPKLIKREILAQDDQILVKSDAKKVKVVLENTKVKPGEDPIVVKP